MASRQRAPRPDLERLRRLRGWGVGAILLAGCSFGWDDLEPRLAEAGGAGGTGGSAGAVSTGGTPSATGGGSSSGSGGGGGGGAGTGGSSAGGMAPASFLDDFNRADDPGIGNGWVEKAPAVFALESDRIVKLTAGVSYRDNLVFRPTTEALLDVEASIEFELTSSTVGRPQVLARTQYATILDPDAYDGYKVWINGSATAALLSLQHGGGGSTALESITIAPPLTQGERYRMRLRVEGTDPVMLEAYVEQESGTGWTIIGSATHADSSATRIDTAGAVGFAGNTATSYILDDFAYQAL